MAPALSFLLPYALAVATGSAVGRYFHLPSLLGIVSIGYIISAASTPSNIIPLYFLASAHPHAELIYHKNKGFAFQLAPLLPAALFLFTSFVYIRSPELIGRGIGYAVFGMTTALALMAFHFSKELAKLDDVASVRIFRAGLLRRFVLASGIAFGAILVFFYTVFFSLSDDKSVLFLDPFRVFGQERFRFDPGLLLRFLALAAALLAVNGPGLFRRRRLFSKADYAQLALCALAWSAAVGSVTFFVYVMGSIQGSTVSAKAYSFMLHHLIVLGVVLGAWAALAMTGAAPAVSDLRQPVWTYRRGATAFWAALFAAAFIGSMYYTESSWYSVAAASALFGAVALAMSSRKRLEDIVQERTFDLNAEKEKVDSLLQNILPVYVIEDLKARGTSEPRSFRDIAVMFTDFVGFTRQSSLLSPELLIDELNEMFTAFDAIVARRGGERIKTIGDGYMAVTGLRPGPGDPAASMLECAREVLAYVESRRRPGRPQWQIRIGIAAGASVGGVVGRTKYLFDLFGDTVNTASRMESYSLPMRVNVSEAVYERLKDSFSFEERAPIEVKGKGSMRMYFLKS
jgi:class 3 adenylate cyclase